MIGFDLTEEQRAMQTLAREFAEREVKPGAAERDRRTDPDACFEWEIVEKMSKLGFRTITLEEKYGGTPQDAVTVALVLEELAVGDLGVAVIINQTAKMVEGFQRTCTEDQGRRFLIPFRDDDRYLIATTTTEPEHGTDALLPYPGTRLDTTAVRDGDEWVINGTKQWSSGAPRAKLLLCAARSEEGRVRLIVPRDTPGVSIGTIHDRVGERFAVNSEVIYDNVRVPKENQLGQAAQQVTIANPWSAACSIGVGRAAYEAALEYAKTRIQGGRRIIEHQIVGTTLAQMFGDLEAARLLYLKAAWSVDHVEYYDQKVSTLSKAICSQTAARVAVQALQIFGGYGATKDFPMEKYVRDAVSFLHSGGTDQARVLQAAILLAEGR